MLEGNMARVAALAATSGTTGLVPTGDYKRAGSFLGLRELIVRKGGDPQAIFARFGIDPAMLDDEEAYVPYSVMIHLIDYCADHLDAPHFGFDLAMGQPADVTGPLAILLLASPTVEQGLTLVARYLAIHAPGARFAFIRQGGDVRMTYEVVELSARYSRQINEYSMAIAYKTMQAMVGPGFHLTGVEIAGAPPQQQPVAVEAFFAAPVAYGRPVSAMLFPETYLHHRIDSGNALLLDFARAHCDAKLQRDDELLDLVANQIRRLLPMGGCSLPMVARQLSIHPRSLQNRLTAEGLEFREIMRMQRLALARAYLTQTRTAIAEIAMLLGYSDQAAFTRAFSSWQGMSPKRYREAHRTPPQPEPHPRAAHGRGR